MKAWLKWAAVTALAAGCLALLVRQVTWDDMAAAFRRVSPGFALLGLAAALACYALKAWRFQLFLGPEARFRSVFGITMAQNVIAGLLPMRAGDFSYVVMVRAAGLGSVGGAVASLVLCRVLDFTVLGIMYLAPLAVLRLEWPEARVAAWVVGVFIFAGVALPAVVLIRGERMVAFMGRVLTATRLIRLRPVAFLWREVEQGTLQLGRAGTPGRLTAIAAQSVLIWVASAAWTWCAWRAVGVAMTVPQILFFSAAAQFFTLLPIFLPTGIGTGDALFAGILVAFGLAADSASAFTLCNRVLTILYTALLALLALALMPRPQQRNSELETEN